MASSKKYGILSYEDSETSDTAYRDESLILANPHLWNPRDVIEVVVWMLFFIILFILWNSMSGWNKNTQKR